MVSIPPPISESTTPAGSSTAIPIKHKPATARLAIAISTIRFSNSTPASLISTSLMKKGDVLGVARIAGIMGAKETSRLIPLCHNIPISGVEMGVEVVEGLRSSTSVGNLQESTNIETGGQAENVATKEAATNDDLTHILNPILGRERKSLKTTHGGVIITARVDTFGQTGVEMEALTAASVAGLTVYDMCKAVDKGMRMEGVRVVLKRGGKSGTWVEDADGVVKEGRPSGL